jgi:dihydroxyacetone kinase-like protein
VYTAPPARAILNTTKKLSNGKGILYISTNHMGDVLNFELVSELAELEGIKSECVFVADDISTAPIERKDERRGVAGIAMVIKIVGAACESGLSLQDVSRIARKASENTYTFSVTTSTGYMPGNGQAMCDLPEGEVEYGMGFNGEPGILHSKLPSANEMTDTILSHLLKDMNLNETDKIAVMINGFGFTSLLELHIVANRVCEALKEKKIAVHDIFVDQLFCPQGTGGFAISMTKLDEELLPYYNAPAYSPLFRKRGLNESDN